MGVRLKLFVQIKHRHSESDGQEDWPQSGKLSNTRAPDHQELKMRYDYDRL